MHWTSDCAQQPTLDVLGSANILALLTYMATVWQVLISLAKWILSKTFQEQVFDYVLFNDVPITILCCFSCRNIALVYT